MNYCFDVRGKPITQGSKKGFVRGGKVAMVESGGQGLKDWRYAMAEEGRRVIGGDPMLEGPISVSIVFTLLKPKSAPKKIVNLLKWPTKRGLDVDKGARAVLDALTGVLYKDDSQVVILTVTKRFDDVLGASIMVTQPYGEWW